MRATIVIVGLVLLFDVSQGGWIPNARSAVLIGLLVEQLVLLFILRSGHVNVVAFITLASFWGAMTYGAWIAGGVYDLSVFVYMVVILAAALLTTWRVSIFFSILSIVSIWGLTIAETRGYLVPTLDSPLSRARDLTTIFLFLAVLIFLLINVLRQALEKIQEDFHERLQAEQALRAGEERFRRIFHASPIAIAISNLEDGRLLDANEAYWKLTGFAPHRSLDHTTVELGIWEDEASRQAFVDNLLKQGALHDPAYEFTRDDGERKIATAYYEVVEFGGRSAILSIFHDVTSQKQAQEALFRSEARIRAMFEAIPDMMFELNPNGVMLQFLPSMSMRPIMPPEEFIGKTVAEALPFIAEQTAFAIRRTLESRQVQAFEYQLEQDGEIRTFEARLIATETDTVLSMVRDVTLIKWAFSEREKLISELESKNAELERFVYTVSHDLKSPLVTIVGFLGYLEEDLKQGNEENLRKDVERIYLAAYRMQELLQDLLELSRVGRVMNPPQEILFEELAKEAIELTEGRLQERGVRTLVNPSLPVVRGDRKRLLELLQNLIDNAAKYMGDQSDPLIEIGQQGFEGKRPILFVRDNGMGVAPEYHENIFGLFNKLNPNSEGTGVGLALARRIAEFHGGRLWIESELGKGATFFFTLPSVQSRLESEM
ncbi:MAG: Adaptive-response sensory-kinase SasA [Anaerolineales bacterium]|nr:Adaptive-response sensory-kinase SasA [Anaerolineales bacterium]WKZ43058.1 MAG: PAS domain S-box protein [Anaerolineales bacterium]